MRRRTTCIGRLLDNSSKWVAEKLGDAKNEYLTTTHKFRCDMWRMAKDDSGLLAFGCRGTSYVIDMAMLALQNVVFLFCMLSCGAGILTVAVMWICMLVLHPMWTMAISALVSVPFIIGCAYGCHISNEIEDGEWEP